MRAGLATAGKPGAGLPSEPRVSVGRVEIQSRPARLGRMRAAMSLRRIEVPPLGPERETLRLQLVALLLKQHVHPLTPAAEVVIRAFETEDTRPLGADPFRAPPAQLAVHRRDTPERRIPKTT